MLWRPSGASTTPNSKLEFAVQMTCQNCVDAVRTALDGVPGLQVLDIQLDNQSVLVDTTLTTEKVQNLLESTGRATVLKGMGSAEPGPLGSAAVAMVSGRGSVQGVVRFLQVSPQRCLVDGTVDGLAPGLHGLHVHDFGDISRGCDSCGEHFNPDGERHGGPGDAQRHAGDLGNILASADGRASFRMEDSRLKVHEIIGRSLVIDAGEDDLGRGSHPLSKITGNSGERVACGIIARSAGLFQNPKKICTCDGVTLWEERECPSAARRGQRATSLPTPHL
ncbi:copper chaperone for superoxide dismutase isoform X2 [Varanus komodoensis]|uniref:copper chaperone for superoxide dismutase isoform X2 n=1 Tax=Varanus komodoensis TaxID=61221 RepID=UPI001CF7E9BB|nr:copper chaperone for superoxide dismutase isoform X2 [Varanus komodoensis]